MPPSTVSLLCVVGSLNPSASKASPPQTTRGDTEIGHGSSSDWQSNRGHEVGRASLKQNLPTIASVDSVTVTLVISSYPDIPQQGECFSDGNSLHPAIKAISASLMGFTAMASLLLISIFAGFHLHPGSSVSVLKFAPFTKQCYQYDLKVP